jgi:hypothetical protein
VVHALRAMDAQTTVSHLGQLARAYAALGQEAKMWEVINQILGFVSGTHYLLSNQLHRYSLPAGKRPGRQTQAQGRRLKHAWSG